MPLQQLPPAQSPSPAQPWPPGQRAAHLAPPQSTPVSALFFFPSKQLTQSPPSQIAFAQSVFVLQGWPSAQIPQSRGVPQPSVWAPHRDPQSCGVQHFSLKQV